MKIKTLLRYFNNCKFRTKMFATFIVGVFIPILLTQIIAYRQNVQFMTQKVNELTVNNLHQKAERVGLTLEVYTNLLYQIYVDEDISANINILMDETAGGKAAAFNQIFNRLRQYDIGDKGVRSISVICKDGTTITYDYQTGSSMDTLWSDYRDMRKIQPYEDAKDKIGMVISPTMKFEKEGKENYFFHISKRIFDLDDLEKGTIATVIMSVNADVLNNICQTEINHDTQEEYAVTFITNENRQVISYPKSMFMGIQLDNEITVRKFIQLSGLLKNKNISINEYNDSRTGWDFYYVYDKNYMLKDIREVQNSFLLLSTVIILFASLLIMYTVRKIVHSISTVIQGMNQIKAGNLEVNVPVESEDEIGQIAYHFNTMTQEVKELIAEVKEATNKQKNAEIKALEAQINPHFLYNTLDSINWKAIEKGEYEISNMLRNLGVILRYSINKSNQLVTIQEMEDWLNKYISLQQVRFNEAFTYKISVENELRGQRVYKLLLQPFIENVIIHAFDGMEQGGYLSVDIIRDGQSICIIIEDNGRGMPEDSVRMYNNRESAIKEDGEHIGIHNVFARLHMYYGEAAAWNIKSMRNLGTVVTLRLPMNPEIERETENLI